MSRPAFRSSASRQAEIKTVRSLIRSWAGELKDWLASAD
jgi:hypothetical protein